MPFPKIRLKEFFTLCFGLVIGLLICETALRILNISYPSFFVVDENLGFSLRPGAEGLFSTEGKAYIKNNSDGLRDREHSFEKTKNTLRIAVLGDSYAQALQVPLENTFWFVAEQQLEQCKALKGRKVEAINFGVSGYGTAQELIILRKKAWKYSPDLVLLAITTGNDIRNNSRKLDQSTLRPYFIDREGQLVLDDAFKNSNEYLSRKSQFYQFGYKIINSFRVMQVLNMFKNRLGSRANMEKRSAQAKGELGLDNMIYQTPDPLWEEAWQVTEKLIVKIRDEVEKKGAEFLAVTLTSGIQVHPDPSTRRAFMEKLGVKDLLYPEKRIKNLAEKENFSVLNLTPTMQRYAETNNVFLHGFDENLGRGHWNKEGHRQAGKAISEFICKRWNEYP